MSIFPGIGVRGMSSMSEMREMREMRKMPRVSRLKLLATYVVRLRIAEAAEGRTMGLGRVVAIDVPFPWFCYLIHSSCTVNTIEKILAGR